MIHAVGAVIPVHDEAEHLSACLAAIDVSFTAIHQVAARIETAAVVVLDSCTDESQAIARAWCEEGSELGPRRVVLAVDARNVGQARAAGMDALLRAFAAHATTHVWLATTDADSEVPPHWLSEQIRMAAEGAEAVAGSIRVADWKGYPEGLGARFQEFYEPAGSGDAHTHVHGANMGVRADAYVAAGGFAPLETGEDHALWNALQRAARLRVSSRRIPVTTSARMFARAPAGFSGFLADFVGHGTTVPTV